MKLNLGEPARLSIITYFEDSCRRSLGSRLRHSLWGSLQMSLLDSLGFSFRGSLRSRLRYRRWRRL